MDLLQKTYQMNTITYAEKKGEKPFNWNEFLKKETYTKDELFDAQELARSWVTCACGSQCALIPRWSNGCPRDQRLMLLVC